MILATGMVSSPAWRFWFEFCSCPPHPLFLTRDACLCVGARTIATLARSVRAESQFLVAKVVVALDRSPLNSHHEEVAWPRTGSHHGSPALLRRVPRPSCLRWNTTVYPKQFRDDPNVRGTCATRRAVPASRRPVVSVQKLAIATILLL